MKDLNLSSKSETQNNSESVNRYFSKTNFAQIPNVLFLYAVQDGEPFDLVIYSLLYSSCFNRRKGDFNTKFNVSTISEILNVDDDKTKDSLKRLIKFKHITIKKKTKLSNDDIYLELWLATRVQGFKKFICDEPVG